MSSVIVAPQRSIDQRRDALFVANEIRIKRSQLKRKIKRGEVDPRHIIALPPDYVLSMKLTHLLRAIHRFGDVRLRRLMRVCMISDTKTLGGLSERQREAVLDYLKAE